MIYIESLVATRQNFPALRRDTYSCSDFDIWGIFLDESTVNLFLFFDIVRLNCALDSVELLIVKKGIPLVLPLERSQLLRRADGDGCAGGICSIFSPPSPLGKSKYVFQSHGVY